MAILASLKNQKDNLFLILACADLEPMLQRAVDNEGFYEWYDVRNGRPKGSGDFGGEAADAFHPIRPSWKFLESYS